MIRVLLDLLLLLLKGEDCHYLFAFLVILFMCVFEKEKACVCVMCECSTGMRE